MLRDDDYLEAKVLTASPAQLHLIVLDGAIRHTTRAIEALRKNDFETSYFALNDARSFVAELISGTNEEHAPDLVSKVRGLFGFVYRNLAEADLHRDVSKAEAAARILRLHRETWLELMEQIRRNPPEELAEPGAASALEGPHILPSEEPEDFGGDGARSWTA